MPNKKLLREYLEIHSNRDLLDSSFLDTAKERDYTCPVHKLPLLVEDGYKSIPDRSLSQMPEPYNEELPYALCWTRGVDAEKHGPIEPAPVVYCAMCNRIQREEEEEKKKIFSKNPDRIYRV